MIDEIARKLGLTKRTLRYYEEQGLLNPAARTAKGYRLYSEDDLARLKQIVELRDVMGFSLTDIGRILKLEDTCSQLTEVYRRGDVPEDETGTIRQLRDDVTLLLSIITRKQAQLTRIQAAYQAKFDRIDSYLKKLECTHEQ